MLFEKFNRGRNGVIKENVKLEEMQFKKLKDFKGETLNVDGYFFTNGDYGLQVCAIANGCKINLPKRAVDMFIAIDNDEEMKKAVEDGRLIITNIDEIKTKKGMTTSFEFKTK